MCGWPPYKTEAQLDDRALAVREGASTLVELLFLQGLADDLERLGGIAVFDEVAELRVPSSPTGVSRLAGSWPDAEKLADLLWTHAQSRRRSPQGWVTAQLQAR